MNPEDIKEFDFEIGSSTNTGRISCTLKGNDQEIQEQINYVLNIYNQLFQKHLAREIIKKQ